MKEGRSDALRKKHRAIIARTKPACHICGQAIDYTLTYPHPRCFVVDHVVAVANGGSDALSNKKAAHHPRVQQQEAGTRLRTHRPPLRRARVTVQSNTPTTTHSNTHSKAPDIRTPVRTPGGAPPHPSRQKVSGHRDRLSLTFFSLPRGGGERG